jgi:DNA-binding XRE family transcriptional regulator
VFSIIYLGQEKLLGKLRTYKEVFWRCLVLNMSDENSQWMNFEERKNYLKAVYGKAISPVARERIAKKTSKPLEMEFYLREKMEDAKAAGKDQLDKDVVGLSLRERREALGASLKDVADRADVGKSTVYDVEEGKPSTKRGNVEEAIREMERKKAEKSNKKQAV